MSKKLTDVAESTTPELNEELINSFAEQLEHWVNKSFKKHDSNDICTELVVALSMVLAQMGYRSGFEIDDLTNIVSNMYDDVLTDETLDTPLTPNEKKMLN